MNIYIKTLIVVVGIGIISGCKVTKDITVPQSVVPDHFRNSFRPDSSSIVNQTVSDFFREMELIDLIDTALIRNFDMQIAFENIESARQIIRQAKMEYLPQLNFQVTGSTSRPSNNGFNTAQLLNTNHIEDFNAGLNLSWEADIWGKIKSQKKAAVAGYFQTEEAKNAIQTQLIASVAQGYYSLMTLDAQIDIAERNLALTNSTLKMIKLQFDAGQVSSLAIQQAKAQQLVAAQLIPRLQQEITIQENALSLLTGHLPGIIKRSANLEYTLVNESTAAGFPSAMVNKRPDVKNAELSLSIANAKLGIAKANLYPSLRITASGGVNSLKASNWFNIPASLFGMVAGGITQPLLQKRMLKTQYELAKIDREKAVIQFRYSVLNAVTEVSDELVKIEKLKQQYAISKEKVNTLQLAVKNANLLFASGMANYLEVITAQSNSLQSELELATIKNEQLNARVELYRTLGGGL
ncbi:MAG: efflux transporter outer membrane subunit [Pedobacter sp.]|uniref:TolC family protein n=1 Tax=Pedobacter sp. TaxID=1411316 RepID=UPI0035683492